MAEENNMFKTARLSAALTIKQVAELTLVPQRTIQNWEAGVRVPPAYITRWYIKELKEFKEEMIMNKYYAIGVLIGYISAKLEAEKKNPKNVDNDLVMAPLTIFGSLVKQALACRIKLDDELLAKYSDLLDADDCTKPLSKESKDAQMQYQMGVMRGHGSSVEELLEALKTAEKSR